MSMGTSDSRMNDRKNKNPPQLPTTESNSKVEESTFSINQIKKNTAAVG